MSLHARLQAVRDDHSDDVLAREPLDVERLREAIYAVATAPTPTECSRIEVGDDVVFLGQPHRIVSIEPYRHPGFLGPWRVAHDAFGWAITLIDGQTLDVVRSPFFSSRELSTARLSAPTRAGVSLDSSLDVREPSMDRPVG